MYADGEDFVFASKRLGDKKPRSGSQLFEDYLRPAANRAGAIRREGGGTHGPNGEVVKRFGFHTFRHSLATCLMDEQENPAVVQAIMRHSKTDMAFTELGEASRPERVLERLVGPTAEGIYSRVMQALRLEEDLAKLAGDDPLGRKGRKLQVRRWRGCDL
jgi:integrase